MSQEIKIRSRIQALKSLNSIFAAMQVITVSKLSRARLGQLTARKYKDGLESAYQLSGRHGERKVKKVSRVAAIVISGSRGLCGTFNQELFFRIQSFIKEHGDREIGFIVFGRKGSDYLKAKKQPVSQYFVSDKFSFDEVKKLADGLYQSYLSGELHEVYLIYNHYYSVLNRKAVANKLLPDENALGDQNEGRVILEPDTRALNRELAKLYFEAQLFSALQESLLGELSSRMVTLKSAIDNSKKLIGELVVQRNKMRQQAITQEILEIIEASESIKGVR